ncbi:MAG: hypothetical protein ACREOU_14260 [Candidatus Eiseniibacteriota bacterium]
MKLALAAIGMSLALLFVVPSSARSASVSAGTSPTLAVEDTIPIPSALLPEFIVTAPRVTLDEILDRVAKGEARRDSMMKDQTYTMLGLVTYIEQKGGKPQGKHKLDFASRVYKKQPDKVREVTLRKRTDFEKKDDDDVEVTASPTMREQLVSFAFEPRLRARYKFSIDRRHLIGGHVVYEIGFAPRSKLDALPTGRVWVDTNEFVIVREEFWYRDRSPAPLFVKSIDSCVLERTQVDGQWWVLSRLLARVQLTSFARFMGRVAREDVPATVDLTVMQTDWKINQGIDDSIFASQTK